MLPHSIEGQYTYTISLTQPWTIIFWFFLGIFAIRGSSVTRMHLPYGFRTTNICPTKSPNGRYLGYVSLECRANLHIKWESFAHRAQGGGEHVYNILPLNHGGEKCQASIRGPIFCKLVKSTLPYFIFESIQKHLSLSNQNHPRGKT